MVNNWLPNFGEILVWFVSFLMISPSLGKIVSGLKGKPVVYFLLLSVPVWMMVYPQLIKLIIVNSTIPIHLSDILKLNVFSLVFILLIGLSSLQLVRFYSLVLGKWEELKPARMEFGGLLLVIFSSVVIANEWIFRLHGFWIIWMFSLFAVCVLVKIGRAHV